MAGSERVVVAKPRHNVMPGWTRSLIFRLAVAINLAVIGVLVSFWLVEYRRERQAHLADQIERLREEGRILRVAQNQLDSPKRFQSYIDAYCRQMQRHISPGHHIIVLNRNGYIVARAHERATTSLEREMMQTPQGGWRRFNHDQHTHAAVGLKGDDGTTILVSQSLAPVQRVIRRLAVGRAFSIGILTVLLLVTIDVLLVRWVRRPIQELVDGVQSITAGEFDRRMDEAVSSEFRVLSNGFNEMASVLQRTDLRRRQEMAKAERIHRQLLPSSGIEIPGAVWAASYRPAETIGGDYYDILPCPDGRFLIVIGDVCGHGVPAALISAMVKTSLRQAVSRGMPLLDTIRYLDHELASLTGAEHFVTFLALCYEPETGRIEYVNCGHDPALVVDPKGRIREKSSLAGLPLGISSHSSREVGTTALEPGDRLYLWTDGLPELPDAREEMLGRDRLMTMLAEAHRTDPQEAVNGVMDDARLFHGSDSFPDDATLVTLWRQA